MKSLLLSALLLAPMIAHAARPLQSPWDGKPATLTSAPYTCPAIRHLSPDLTTNGFYSDSRSSIIDPVKWRAYVESAGPYKHLGQRMA